MSTKRNRVLALHGFTGRGEDFAEFSPLCHTIDAWHCPDLPGHGPNPQIDCTPEATVAFIDTHANAANILLGYSMGARAALLHAVKNPAYWDALILISPNPGIEAAGERHKRQAADEKLAQMIEQVGLASFLSYWQSRPLIQSQQRIKTSWREAMGRNRLQHSEAGLASSLRGFGQGSYPNLWNKVAALSTPMLLITGTEDHKYTGIAERLTAGLIHSEHSRIASASHMPHLEMPEATAKLIDRFIAGHLRP